jgi:hypothetical protein
MKNLFNEYEAYTTDGSLLDNAVYRQIKPLFLTWVEKGFSIRDIEAIFIDNIASLSAERRLLKSITMRKEEQNEDNNN